MTSTLIPAMKELQYIAVSPENPLKVVDVGVARGSFMVELDKLVHRMNVFAVGIDPVPRDGAEDRYDKFYFACADNVESWPKSPTKGLLYSDPEDDQASSLFPRGEVLKKDGKEVDVLNLNDIIEEDIPSGPIHFLKIDAEGKDLDIVNRSIPDKKDTNDEDIKKQLKKMIKQRSESIEMYKKNNRNDLVEIEEKEAKVLSEYLPKQLSEEETKNICSELVKKIGASSIKDMGKVMGELKKNHSDSIDFSKAGTILKGILNK